MGIYALARRSGVTIRSRPRPAGGRQLPAWEVHLAPEHFLGDKLAAVNVIDDESLAFGTEDRLRRRQGQHRQRRLRRLALPAAGHLQRQETSTAGTSCTTLSTSSSGGASASASNRADTIREGSPS